MAIISTSRELRPRAEADFYPTPIPLCQAVVNNIIPVDFNPTFICDPGAGTGNWGRALYETMKYKNSYLVGVEIQNSDVDIYSAWCIEDYLKHENIFGNYDLIIGNPPYKQAEEFIRHSLDMLSDGGYLIFLLRLSMLESMKRGRGLWKDTPIKEVWVSMRRIPFYGKGSDDTAYGIYVWQKGYVGLAILKWLDWELGD